MPCAVPVKPSRFGSIDGILILRPMIFRFIPNNQRKSLQYKQDSVDYHTGKRVSIFLDKSPCLPIRVWQAYALHGDTVSSASDGFVK